MQRPRSLRQALVVYLVLATFGITLVVGLFSYAYLKGKTAENVTIKNELLVKAFSGEVRSILREPQTILNQLITYLATHDHTDQEINTIIQETVLKSKFFESIMVLNQRGIITHAGFTDSRKNRMKDYIGIDFSGKQYFRQAAKSTRPTWSNMFLSMITARMSLTLSIPFGRTIYVGSFSIQHLQDVTRALQAGNNIVTSIIDSNGALIFYSDYTKVAQHLNLGSIAPVRNALRGEFGTSTYTVDGISYMGSTYMIPETGWFLLVSQTVESAFAPVYRVTNIFIFGMILLIVIVAAVSALLSRKLTDPLSALTAYSRDIAQGNYQGIIPRKTYAEIEGLAETFRTMVAEIQSRENELFQSKERYRLLVETMTDGIVMVNADGTITYANPMLCTMLGYRSEEILGKGVSDFIDADNQIILNEQMEKRRQGKTVSYMLEWKSRAGRTLKTLMSPKPLFNEHHAFIGSFAVVTDITDQEKAAEALRLSEEKFSKAFRSSPAFVTLTTLHEGIFVDVNDSFLEATGYSRDEVIGHTSLSLGMWLTSDDRQRIVHLLETEGRINSLEFRMKVRSGDIIHVLYSAEIMYIHKKPHIIAVTLDITRRKKLETQLLHSQKMEAVGQLAGGVAHDFNNILTAIIGYSYLIRNKLDRDNPLSDSISKILALSDRGSQIVQGLLTFSRKQYFEMRNIRINDVVRNVERLLSKFIGEDIRIVLNLTEKEPVITADSTQVEQVLMNLATNARDAMPDGGSLVIKTEVVALDDYDRRSLELEKAGEYALLTVTDSGTGIDAKTKEKIFEPFYTTKEVGKGTGLGLAIVYGVVRQHKGSITVFSRSYHGTAFHIYLPCYRPLPVEGKKEEMLSPDKTLYGAGETVLIAEDEEQVRKTMQNILEEFNYSVITAEDGRDAVAKYTEDRDSIGLVILDVIMPEMNGREAYDAIKKLTPDVKVIFTSGYTADVIQRQKVVESDALLITKPITPVHLLLKVRELLNNSA